MIDDICACDDQITKVWLNNRPNIAGTATICGATYWRITHTTNERALLDAFGKKFEGYKVGFKPLLPELSISMSTLQASQNSSWRLWLIFRRWRLQVWNIPVCRSITHHIMSSIQIIIPFARCSFYHSSPIILLRKPYCDVPFGDVKSGEYISTGIYSMEIHFIYHPWPEWTQEISQIPLDNGGMDLNLKFNATFFIFFLKIVILSNNTVLIFTERCAETLVITNFSSLKLLVGLRCYQFLAAQLKRWSSTTGSFTPMVLCYWHK